MNWYSTLGPERSYLIQFGIGEKCYEKLAICLRGIVLNLCLVGKLLDITYYELIWKNLHLVQKDYYNIQEDG